MRLSPRWIAGCVLLGACAEGGEPGRAGAWRAERDTLGDTIVVRTLAGSVRPVARLVETMSIGAADGEAEAYLLGNMRAIAVAPDGSVYLSDAGPVLRKYGPDGTFVRAFGRSGRGPGEYSQPDGGLAVLPDGRVVIRDPGNGHLSVFSADGEPLATWRIPSTLNTGRRLYADTAGNLRTLVVTDPGTGPGDWKMGLARFGPDGTPGDSVPAPEWEYEPAVISGQSRNSSSYEDVAFTPQVHWTFSPFGYYVGGLSSAYRIDLLRSGAPVLRIERTTPAVPVASDEAGDHRRVATENMRRNFPGWTWNGPDIPGTKPPFRGIFAAEDGRIWVLLSRPGVRSAEAPDETAAGRFSEPLWSEPTVFDVFEPDGTYLGEVSAPEGFLRYPEPVFRGDTVWAATEDSDGVRYVKRLEVTIAGG
jgi:hypothetical protein